MPLFRVELAEVEGLDEEGVPTPYNMKCMTVSLPLSVTLVSPLSVFLCLSVLSLCLSGSLSLSNVRVLYGAGSGGARRRWAQSAGEVGAAPLP